MTLDSLSALLADFEPLDSDIVDLLALEPGRWSARYEDRDILIEADEPSQRLVLTVAVGRPPAEKRLAVFTTLLSYALLWRETGGVRMGLTVAGEVVQIADIGMDEVTHPLLSTVLDNLLAKARQWEAYIANGDPAQSGKTPPLPGYDLRA